jgi:hypothetical protein
MTTDRLPEYDEQGYRKHPNGHRLLTPATCGCASSYCPVCDGGLGVCRDCGAAEIELDMPCVPPAGPKVTLIDG